MPRKGCAVARAGEFQPTKGGDHPTYAAVVPSSKAHGRANSRRTLPHWLDAVGIDAMLPSADPNDRAHNVRDGLSKLLLPAYRVSPQHKQTRLYPACQLNGAGLPPDSVLDRLHEIQVRFATQLGVALGLVSPRLAETAASFESGLGDIRLRDVLEQRTTQASTASERMLEAQASRLLNGGRG